MGKCPDCGQWDALEEYRVESGAAMDRQRGSAASIVASTTGGAGPSGSPLVGAESSSPKAVLLSNAEEEASASGKLVRFSTGLTELDRVLGGAPPMGAESDPAKLAAPPGNMGLVPGSVVLVGGDPGIGKSTLLLQSAHHWAAAGFRVLYVTSEESAYQLRMRAKRLGVQSRSAKAGKDDNDGGELYVLADTNLARIVDQTTRVKPAIVIVDSIQMIYKGDLPAAPGSVTQLRACCQELVYLAKITGCAVVLVGHVTKEGRLAGPRLLEHMVDTVLYFEGDRYHSHRIIRAIKNRFGSTLEVGLFEMTDGGLKQVADGARLLAAEYRPMSGSVVCPVLQGSRCLLVEIQALTATGFLGAAKRKTSGIDASRLAMLIAVLEKRGGLRLADQDIFTSSVGGVKIAEPAADLALALAIAGAHHDRKLAPGVCAVGEIGLGGEVRYVQQLDQRIHEAARLGFTHIVLPKSKLKAPKGCELLPVGSLAQAIDILG